MRIAFLIDVFPRLSNTFVLNQLTGLLDRGHEVDIFAGASVTEGDVHPDVYRYRLLERMRRIPLPKSYAARVLKAARLLSAPSAWHPAVLSAFNIRRHGRRALALSQLYTTLSFLKEDSYDIVHAQFGTLGLVALPLLRTGVISGKLVTSFRGADITSHGPALYRELLREGHHFLPVSQLFANKLLEAGGDAAKITVHHSGIDCQRFTFAERERAPGEATRVIFIGRLTEKKGIEDAVRAVAGAIASGCRLELTIIGDGELRPRLEGLIAQQKIGAQVVLLGQQTQDAVINWLERSHLLIAPSVTAKNGDQEGIPNVLKEAMAMGLPVLSTYHSGIPELVENGVSGFLVPERDPAALAERLGHLADHPELWPAMGRAGRAKIEAEYDINKLNDELVCLYQSLLST